MLKETNLHFGYLPRFDIRKNSYFGYNTRFFEEKNLNI